MRLLLDTHTFLWAVQGDSRLPLSVIELLEDPQHTVLLSLVSVWEMAIKKGLGKLELGNTLEGFVEEKISLYGVELLPIHYRHLLRVEALPPFHRDPFDRLLIAQAIEENLPLVSLDSHVRTYPVQLLP